MKSQEANLKRNKDEGVFTVPGWICLYGHGLTRRGLQCVVLAATGKSGKQIARELGISPGTVTNRMADARLHLKATNRTELVAKAVAAGIIAANEAEPCA
ncbi:helix-turn-helix transcriptional regulator [Pseudomonas entomophila]|uniref:helix-turn-helix transcriptional regulator n=1 Tax=Pseudomonas entomophila TaxID=312306 RepID=UPI0015E45C5C|nr:helix-turn-helix transcriptional regulator [Pseudomonas entomophila]MBA1194505.1 helix-turn-helix transcriptional regulator [Pseudomonas entomophila]